jgi:glycosyltransferase involved in cell wall biosynthesis
MKLSIITINCNNANDLRQTLASVAEQTFEDFEHIIIDGASNDNSVDIIKNFSHITYYISEPDNGIYDAMNKGIKQAKGEYCLFLNSGDYLISQTVLAQVFCNQFEEDIIFGNPYIKSSKGDIKKIIKPDNFFITFFAENYLSHQSTFIRTDLSIMSDWAFFLNAIYRYGASYKHCQVFVSVFTKDGISANPKNISLMQNEKEKIWKELFPLLYKDILGLAELEAELKRIYKIPGVKFIMKYIYPLYKKMRIKAIRG